VPFRNKTVAIVVDVVEDHIKVMRLLLDASCHLGCLDRQAPRQYSPCSKGLEIGLWGKLRFKLRKELIFVYEIVLEWHFCKNWSPYS